MQRSTFIKLAASTVAVAGAKAAFPWAAEAATVPVSYAGKLWRGAARGKVQTSADGGRTWKLHSSIGGMYTIKSFVVRNGRLRMSVGYAGRTFPLVLGRDKRSWRTV